MGLCPFSTKHDVQSPLEITDPLPRRVNLGEWLETVKEAPTSRLYYIMIGGCLQRTRHTSWQSHGVRADSEVKCACEETLLWGHAVLPTNGDIGLGYDTLVCTLCYFLYIGYP